MVDLKEVEDTIKDIEKRFSDKKKQIKEKRSYLLSTLKKHKSEQENKKDKDIDTENKIKAMLVDAIRKDVIKEYYLGYDSMGEGLEPLYFWTLDFMRDRAPGGMGLTVTKSLEGIEASASSSYFGEMGTRASVMQDRAMKILEVVNNLIRTIINIIYDLKEFEIKLGTYDDLHSKESSRKEAARLALKGAWMDQVDIKRGRGSINMLSQQLQFVTVRDAFMQARDEADANKMDLNQRVKNILLRKVNEYLKWEKNSEEELRKRFEIERRWLSSQVNSVKLYIQWIKPYLKAAQKLGMKEFKAPDVVAAFNNMQMELSIFGRREIKPEDVNPNFTKVKIPEKLFIGLEINFNFRTVPQSIPSKSGSSYVHAGRTDINFKGYVLDEDEVEAIEKQELYEDMQLVRNLTEISLEALQKDLDHFLKEIDDQRRKESEKPKKEKLKLESPFGNLGGGFKEMFSPFKNVSEQVKDLIGISKKGHISSFKLGEIKKFAQEEARDTCWNAYDKYKKAHGMITW
ncbi:MAG: hypothetical protein WC413_01900 [Candidatus Nanoarchaeia archaeon]